MTLSRKEKETIMTMARNWDFSDYQRREARILSNYTGSNRDRRLADLRSRAWVKRCCEYEAVAP